MEDRDAQARKRVWEGALPLHIRLHPSEVTTLPPPPPFLTLAPRNSYLPLLGDLIRPHFQNALPPGTEALWFEYQGLPLKWHIPTGVLFDLLCLEPERPWKLVVHFRTYPSDVLSPYEGDEAAKWSYMNTLKEASYIMYGSTKTVMNMSQSDQVELWRSTVKGDLESYERIAVRLIPNFGSFRGSSTRQASTLESDEAAASGRTGSESIGPGKIPLRLYVRNVQGGWTDPFSVPHICSWDEITTMTRPFEVPRHENVRWTLKDALFKAAPQLFTLERSADNALKEQEYDSAYEDNAGLTVQVDVTSSSLHLELMKLKGIVRIQGIEPNLDLPLDWIARNLCGTENFVHVAISTWLPST